MQHKQFRRLGFLVPPLLFLSVFALILGNLQAISDYVKLRGYTAPQAVVQLADQTGMTADARRIFYVNHPQVADRTTFNGACNSKGERTIVLGCYHSVDRGIYLYNVTDVRLNGVEQVTAAHEMLHAAYDRLSKTERANIDSQLKSFYERQVTDKRIRDTIAAYEISEPNDVVNEMHSILATEVSVLPQELEQYYQRYFTDRSKVVAFANTYQSEFTSRQDKVKSYDARLETLKSSIDTNTADLKRREAEINAMQQQLNSYRASNAVSQYNSLVPVYNGKIDEYNELIRTTQAKITEYNNLVKERNNLAMEIRGLSQSINSQLEPIQ